MNEPADKVLSVLEPPAGGLARLLARRDSRLRQATPPWWALAAGVATGIVWTALLTGHTEIRMQLSGARLLGERSQGVGVQMLGGGRAVPLSSNAGDVQFYWLERPEITQTGDSPNRAPNP